MREDLLLVLALGASLTLLIAGLASLTQVSP